MRNRLIVTGLLAGIVATIIWSMTADADPDPELIRSIAATGVNQTGWQQIDPEAWFSLANDACSNEAWEPDVSETMASEFMRTHGVEGQGSISELQMTIWQIMHQACNDKVPAGATPPHPVNP
jgi:hypothetical protein